ncbi:plasmid mobilization protein [Haloarcula argentinensis]|uniref:Ribbon-helix-helix protein, CopG family n=1 Tax=Haloarcula argentinensis TaxID=43776 RepID=A0ABU2F7P0_HALAR|nr:ribbon-helix-helix protein, CopG family [Haloarcula argentinensis]MDS0256061.1 ribbon-helix-helix protein, CopG family [Haloarcula argentinensis]
MSDKESIGAKVDPAVKQEIRIAAAKQGVSMSEYIREAVLDRLEKEKAEEGNPKHPTTAD